MNEQQLNAIVAIPICPTIADGPSKPREVALSARHYWLSSTNIANIARKENCYVYRSL